MKLAILRKAFAGFILCLIFTSNIPAQTLTWGYNYNGQLGIANFRTVHAMPQVVPFHSDITGVGGGWLHTLFLKADGTVIAAGQNDTGQLGMGRPTHPIFRTVQVVNLTDVVQVAGGAIFSLALKSDGTVWAWGSNNSGQLGLGSGAPPDFVPNPVRVEGLNNIVAIDAGANHALALGSDGTVWGWGSNQYAQLGLGYNSTDQCECIPYPVQVGANIPAFKDIIAVSAEYHRGIALKSDGTVWEWGTGNANSVYAYPRQNRLLSDISQIRAGMYHSVALKSDGSVFVWGSAPYGQLGNGTFTNSYLAPPTQANISDVVEIAAGDDMTIARKRDGTVWAWGYNYFGQLGNGTILTSPPFGINVPVQVFAGEGIAAISATYRQAFAVKPFIQTPVGFGVRHYGDRVDILFANVMNSGTTFYAALDPTTTAAKIPAGYSIQPNQPAYHISTTAQTAGSIDVCVKVNERNRIEFPMLKILQLEGKNWVDRTFSGDFMRQQICARVDSLSSFVVAEIGSGVKN